MYKPVAVDDSNRAMNPILIVFLHELVFVELDRKSQLACH